MEALQNGNIRSAWLQRFMIMAVVGALLVGAAYVWGNRLSASTKQSPSLASLAASDARFAAMDAFYGAATK
jgi:hypothetical protein